jgi:predicted restriction endonuclease
MQKESIYYSFLSEIYNFCSKSFYNGNFRPHKLLLLLSIIDLLESKYIIENKIYLNAMLFSTFTKHYNFLDNNKFLNRPWYPYFHLRSSKFWNHKIKPGLEKEYQLLKSEHGVKKINSIIDYSFFDDETFDILQNRIYREKIESIILKIIGENLEQ